MAGFFKKGSQDERESCIRETSLYLAFFIAQYLLSCSMFPVSHFLSLFFFFRLSNGVTFEHDVFFLQLGRGRTAPRLIRLVWLYSPTHRHNFLIWMKHIQALWIDQTTFPVRLDAWQEEPHYSLLNFKQLHSMKWFHLTNKSNSHWLPNSSYMHSIHVETFHLKEALHLKSGHFSR